MSIVYAVNAGSYSDYRVVAIFTTKELAQEFMDFVPSNDYNDIEEFELNPNTIDLINRGYSIWLVKMLRDGSTQEVRQQEIKEHNVFDRCHIVWGRNKSLGHDDGRPDYMSVYLWAKSPDHAVKVANEKRIQIIAKGEWGEPA